MSVRVLVCSTQDILSDAPLTRILDPRQPICEHTLFRRKPSRCYPPVLTKHDNHVAGNASTTAPITVYRTHNTTQQSRLWVEMLQTSAKQPNPGCYGVGLQLKNPSLQFWNKYSAWAYTGNLPKNMELKKKEIQFFPSKTLLTNVDIFVVICRVTNFLPKLADMLLFSIILFFEFPYFRVLPYSVWVDSPSLMPALCFAQTPQLVQGLG